MFFEGVDEWRNWSVGCGEWKWEVRPIAWARKGVRSQAHGRLQLADFCKARAGILWIRVRQETVYTLSNSHSTQRAHKQAMPQMNCVIMW
jgi:hypothetical protein